MDEHKVGVMAVCKWGSVCGQSSRVNMTVGPASGGVGETS